MIFDFLTDGERIANLCVSRLETFWQYMCIGKSCLLEVGEASTGIALFFTLFYFAGNFFHL